MITPKLERAGQVEVPFQGSFFLGDDFPMALPWAKREVPLAGRPIAHDPENSYMWYDAELCRQHGQFACPVVTLAKPARSNLAGPMVAPLSVSSRSCAALPE